MQDPRDLERELRSPTIPAVFGRSYPFVKPVTLVPAVRPIPHPSCRVTIRSNDDDDDDDIGAKSPHRGSASAGDFQPVGKRAGGWTGARLITADLTAILECRGLDCV